MYIPQDKFLHLFVGPTLSNISFDENWKTGIVIHPPVRREDISKLIKLASPGTMAIVDGTFHAYPAVGHAEILQAIKCGWTVWGLSSIGAIRAAEMHSLGMQGFGQVFQEYLDHDLSDDEVALLHQEDPPYKNLSEPLIHIRFFICKLMEKKLLLPESGEEIIVLLKNTWYGNRTLAKLQDYLIQFNAYDNQIKEIMHNFFPFQIKAHDLIRFLSTKPWLKKEYYDCR